jgi:LysR family glycine cleavage system transcriptional activator
MQQKAPPIQWLPVFETAARLLNFKKAAEELCITPPAVSQRIKILEAYLGVTLFDRSDRKLRLSQAGEFYQRIASDIIKQHAKGYRELERKYCHPILQISAPIFIAQELLIPNYMKFKEYAPNVELRITTGNEYVNFYDEPVDVALRFGAGDWPDLECRMVSKVDIKLVCSQTYLDNHDMSASDFLTKDHLEEQVLISLYENLQDWNSHYSGIQPKQKIICDSYFSVVRSAEEGLGIAVGLTPAINRTIREGRLLTLTSDVVNTDFAYWLVAPKNNVESVHFDALYRWISSLFEPLR